MKNNIEALTQDLKNLCTQESEIKRALNSASDTLHEARDNMNGLESSTGALIKAQTAHDALKGALENSVKKIEAKRYEIADAQKAAQREQDLLDLTDAQRRYNEAQAAIASRCAASSRRR